MYCSLWFKSINGDSYTNRCHVELRVVASRVFNPDRVNSRREPRYRQYRVQASQAKPLSCSAFWIKNVEAKEKVAGSLEGYDRTAICTNALWVLSFLTKFGSSNPEFCSGTRIESAERMHCSAFMASEFFHNEWSSPPDWQPYQDPSWLLLSKNSEAMRKSPKRSNAGRTTPSASSGASVVGASSISKPAFYKPFKNRYRTGLRSRVRDYLLGPANMKAPCRSHRRLNEQSPWESRPRYWHFR